MTELSRARWIHLGLALLVVVVFAPHLGGDFLWDDRAYLANDPRMHRADGLRALLTQPFIPGSSVYRPVSTVTFWLQSRAFGMRLPPLRAFNIGLHLAVVQVLFLSLRRASLSTLAAALGAAVFAVHPATTEAVMFVNGRNDGLGALCALAAVLAWTDPARPPWRPLAGTASVALALGCKESFVALPPVLALAQVVCARAPSWRRDVATQLGLSAAAAAAFFAWRAHLHIPSSSDQLRAGVGPSLVALGSVIAHDAGLALRFAQAPTAQSWRPLGVAAAAGVAALGAALLALLGAWRRRDRARAEIAALGLAWFVALSAPNALVIPLSGQFANRYLYAPLLGFAAAVAVALDALTAEALPARRRLVVAGAGALVLLCAAISTGQAARWRTGLSLFGADLASPPDDARQLYHYAVYVTRARGCAEALPLFERVTALEPSYARGWHNVAGCLVQMQRYREAVAPGLRAYRLGPDDAGSLLNLGVALVASGDAARGRPLLARACQRLPQEPICAR